MLPVDVKMALINFHELKKSLPRIDDEITVITEKRYKIGGSVIKMPENTIPREVIIIDNMMKMDNLKRTLSIHNYLIHVSLEFVKFLQDRNPMLADMVIDKFIKKVRVSDMEMKYHYTNRQMNRIIDNLINAYIEAT